MGAAFLDMEAAWGRYIRQSGKDLDWFKRDPIHANERGEQILGTSSPATSLIPRAPGNRRRTRRPTRCVLRSSTGSRTGSSAS